MNPFEVMALSAEDLDLLEENAHRLSEALQRRNSGNGF
jgi:hypothetical protein